ncbi:MAG: hypothetical protein ABIJ57_13435 [Pseudomonadota bacterium]|uniref:Uncharacterized protein n=1 Tax=viral metagenome TaxID=1070528 RepID=A0A6M3LLK1_9ZZZZ
MVSVKLPPKLRIGPFDFDIVVWSNEKGTDVGKFGEFSVVDGTISLDVTREHKTLDTLIHEILHAIWWTGNLAEENVSEEDAVSALSTGLLLMLRDNPEILKIINQWAKRTRTL